MIDKLVKESVKGLKPYMPNKYSYKYKMDANESPFILESFVMDKIIGRFKKVSLNYYPDTDANILTKKIAQYVGVEQENIITGNGSDEMIKLLLETFVDKSDTVLAHTPTFVMYKHGCDIIGANYIGIESDDNFNIDVDEIIDASKRLKPKVIFICNPNNPTGNIISKTDIIKIIKQTNAIVVVDEAYIEFGGETVISLVNKFDNLIVLRTLSKAFGLAGIRTGYLVSNTEIINYIKAVKPPYNLNAISQIVGEIILDEKTFISNNIEYIKKQRDKLYAEMKKIDDIIVYPSETNFILFSIDRENIFEELLKRGFMIRPFNGGKLNGCFRVTVGKSEENKLFVDTLREVVKI